MFVKENFSDLTSWFHGFILYESHKKEQNWERLKSRKVKMRCYYSFHCLEKVNEIIFVKMFCELQRYMKI
jgi:hypothetical protein